MKYAKEVVCCVCEEEKSINEGIHIFSEFLCRECESEIVRTETNTRRYRYFVQKLKRLTTFKSSV
ncbi:sigma factor G inhibitor Gin [Bacillus sp. CGMCC 1.16541]|uniref:sigma factor G inhibitor Gin n=1 Tax=Bacillus sp. CGMCC 1.16541 TaxID=2185143 RepID=UPI000D733D36|nr:sigma factor G inhibitor Gin [Bacillus sp. CGMCC 1.16541]